MGSPLRCWRSGSAFSADRSRAEFSERHLPLVYIILDEPSRFDAIEAAVAGR